MTPLQGGLGGGEKEEEEKEDEKDPCSYGHNICKFCAKGGSVRQT